MSNPSMAIPDASPRDREVQHVVLRLVEAYAFDEAHAVLAARLSEIRASRRSHLEHLFLAWSDLPVEGRPDFLSYAHHRRRPEIEEGTS